MWTPFTHNNREYISSWTSFPLANNCACNEHVTHVDSLFYYTCHSHIFDRFLLIRFQCCKKVKLHCQLSGVLVHRGLRMAEQSYSYEPLICQLASLANLKVLRGLWSHFSVLSLIMYHVISKSPFCKVALDRLALYFNIPLKARACISAISQISIIAFDTLSGLSIRAYMMEYSVRVFYQLYYVMYLFLRLKKF